MIVVMPRRRSIRAFFVSSFRAQNARIYRCKKIVPLGTEDLNSTEMERETFRQAGNTTLAETSPLRKNSLPQHKVITAAYGDSSFAALQHDGRGRALAVAGKHQGTLSA